MNNLGSFEEILMPETFGLHVDRLVTIEMRRTGDPSRGIIVPLYEAAARAQQGRPLTLLAAEGLIKSIARGRYVLLMTGSGRAPWRPRGETDGPLGVVSLARALKLGLGARPVYVAADPYLPPVVAASEAAGITPSSDRTMAEFDGFYPTALLRPFTLKREQAQDRARAILDELNPAAVVSIETLSPNEKGVIHSATGYERESEHVAHTFHLVEEARERGIFTIGIGDFGNEVGCGLIAEEAKKINPYGMKCKCPCGAGVVSRIPTDVLVIGNISNWAAYGVSACLAYLCKEPDLLQGVDAERRMGLDCVYAGAEDGGSMKQP
jgi:D-glutamate cyclase